MAIQHSRQVGKGSLSSTAMPILTFLAIALGIVLFDRLDGLPFYIDLDDDIRRLQIRELLGHGNFFDLTLGFIKTPEPVISHYSRIVDLPYFLIASVLSTFLSAETALNIATLVWPPAMLLGFGWLCVTIANRVNGEAIGLLQATIMAFLMTYAILQFSPGRIDHHNVQLLLVAATIAGFLRNDFADGLMAGIATAASLGAGLEGLPYLAVIWGTAVVLASISPAVFRIPLMTAGTGLAISIVPLSYLAAGSRGVFGTYCDAIGAPFTLAAVGSGLVLVAATGWWSRYSLSGLFPFIVRLASIGIPAAAVIASVIYLYPECLAGPYHAVDELSRSLWLDRLQQEQSLFEAMSIDSVLSGNVFLAVLFCSICAAIVLAAIPVQFDRLREGDASGFLVLIPAAFAVILCVVVLRSMPFMVALAPLMLPAAARFYHRAKQSSGITHGFDRIWVAFSVVAPALLFGGSYLLIERLERPILSSFELLAYDTCIGNDISQLEEADGGLVLAGQALSIRIASEHPQHGVATATIHRAWRGTERMFKVFMSESSIEAAQFLAPYDYLAICVRDIGQSEMDKVPLLDALMKSEDLAGLVPISPDKNTAFRLYRIDHSALK